MSFDTTRLRRGEIVAAAGSVLLFVFLFFFKWYGVSIPGNVGKLADQLGVDLGAASVTGWDGHSVLRWLMLLTIIAGLGLAFLTATQRTVALPVTAAVVTTAIAALTTLLLLYRVGLNEPGPNKLIAVKLGAYLGLLASAAVTYGGYLAMKEEGTSIADAREQARAAGAQARAAFDNTTPQGGEGTGSAPPPPASEAPVSPSPAPVSPPPSAPASPPPSAPLSPPPAPVAPPPAFSPPPADEPADDAADESPSDLPPAAS